MRKRYLSRRDFLRMTSVGTAALVLAACGAQPAAEESGGEAAGETSSAPSSPDPATLAYWFWADSPEQGALTTDPINEFVEQTPTADRQKLRQLWRNLQRAGSEAKKTQHSRLIYRSIKEYLDY